MTSPELTRQQLLRGVTGGAAAVGAAGVLAACGTTTPTTEDVIQQIGRTTAAFDPTVARRFDRGDIGILKYALTLEQLENDFYAKVVKSGLLSGREREVIRDIRDNEREHLDELTRTMKKLGGEPPDPPKTQFPLDSRESILDTAAELENLGAAAYLGQASRIQNVQVMASALAIHSVESAHAAVLNLITGRQLSPDGSVGAPRDAGYVLNQAGRYIRA